MTWDFDQPDLPDTPPERAIMLQNMLIALAENGGLDNATYAQLRTEFMAGVKRPGEGANEGKTPAISDAQAKKLLRAPEGDSLKAVTFRVSY